MLVVMLLAFRGAGVADSGAKLENFPDDVVVGPRSTQADPACGLTDIGAVEAAANTLRHVHLLGRAGVRTAEAHLRAIHQVMDGIA